MSWTVRHREQQKSASGSDPLSGHPDMSADWLSPGVRRNAAEPADRRAERLTRTATAVDIGRRSAQEELQDVAEALERLMPDLDRGSDRRSGFDRGDLTPQSNRRDRRAAAAQRPEHADRQRQGDARSGRIEAVLKALDRLDRRVDDLSRSPEPSSRNRQAWEYEASSQSAVANRSRHFDPAGEFLSKPRARTEEPDTGFGLEFDKGNRGGKPKGEGAGGPDDMRPFLRELSAKIDRLNTPQGLGYSELRQEIGSLRDVLENRSRVGFGERGERDILRLVEAVESLRADRIDARLVQSLRNEIADLRGSLNHSNVEGLLQSLESGYVHLVERLDDLGRTIVDPNLLQGVGQRLAEIEEGFRGLPRAGQILALENRVSDIGHKMDEIALLGSGRGLERLEAEIRDLSILVEKFDVRHLVRDLNERMRDVALRLDDIDILVAEQRGFADRLSGMESRMVDGRAVDRLQQRLEEITAMLAEDRNRSHADTSERMDARFDDIVGRLDRIEGGKAAPRSYDAAFTLLEKRLAAIDGKIDAFDRNRVYPSGDGKDFSLDGDVIGRLEAGIARLSDRLDNSRPESASDITSLRYEIAALRKSLDTQPSSVELEARLRDLSEALSSGAPLTTGGDERLLGLIEEKVAGLAAQLDAAESRLSLLGINAGAGNGADLANAVNDAISGALRKDLKKLLQSANQSEHVQFNSAEEVQSLLASINARLAALEGSQGVVAPPPPSSKQISTIDSDLPLEPGSGKPRDMSVRVASASLPNTEMGGKVARSPQEDARNRKADFIAAARRAAQAAAAEAAGQSASNADIPGSDEKKSVVASKAGWLRDRLGKGREMQEIASADDDRQGQTRKAIRAEIAASMASLRADRSSAEPTEAGTQTNAQAGLVVPSTSRRRALLLAAAAVLLAIGTLQAFRLVSTPEPDLASLNKPVAVIEPSVRADTTAEPAAIVAPLEATGTVAAPIIDADRPEIDSPVAPTQSEAPAEGLHETTGGEDLAFGPPAGVANSFDPSDTVPPPAHFDAAARPDNNNTAFAGLTESLPEEIGPLALRQAASEGNPAALFEIAARYSDGVGVKPDLGQAVKYYEIAASGGLAPAQYRLGSLYEKGQGVAKDLEAAKLWYSRAAERGNAKATHNLAVLYAEGINGEPEFAKAAEWFERSAGFGVRDSQYNLGILFARGLGVEKNLVDSYKWFALAARQGDADAAKKRDEVANILDKAGLAEARLAVDTWKQTPLDPATNEVESNPAWTKAGDTLSKASAVGASGDLVLNVQKLLARLGYNAGTADGRFGPQTREAVIAFQKEAGLPETGTIDKELLKALLGRSI